MLRRQSVMDCNQNEKEPKIKRDGALRLSLFMIVFGDADGSRPAWACQRQPTDAGFGQQIVQQRTVTMMAAPSSRLEPGLATAS
jgi:hypothetical protein